MIILTITIVIVIFRLNRKKKKVKTTHFDRNTTVTIQIHEFNLFFYCFVHSHNRHTETRGNKIYNLYMCLFPCVCVTVGYLYCNLDNCQCICNVSVVFPSSQKQIGSVISQQSQLCKTSCTVEFHQKNGQFFRFLSNYRHKCNCIALQFFSYKPAAFS